MSEVVIIHQIFHPDLRNINLPQFLKRLGDLNAKYEKSYADIAVSFRGPGEANDNCCVELTGVAK